MKKLLLIAGLALGATALASSANAKTYKGVWSSGNASTLKIISAKKVKYCFIDQCTTQKFKGDPEGTISFSWTPAHRYTFTKTSTGYHGMYNDDKDMTVDVK